MKEELIKYQEDFDKVNQILEWSDYSVKRYLKDLGLQYNTHKNHFTKNKPLPLWAKALKVCFERFNEEDEIVHTYQHYDVVLDKLLLCDILDWLVVVIDQEWDEIDNYDKHIMSGLLYMLKQKEEELKAFE